MRLRCIGRYRSGAGDYSAGQVVDVADDVAEFLLRDSPGSFARDDGLPAIAEGSEVAGDSASEPDLSAMSTETATGLVTPDRRQRGGRLR